MGNKRSGKVREIAGELKMKRRTLVVSSLRFLNSKGRMI